MKKLLLNFQMCPLDVELGKELLALLCDLEDAPREDVIFMLTRRFDMPEDKALCDVVRQKFPNFISYQTKRQGIGWPSGPNDMFGDSYMNAVMLARGGMPIDAVFFMECDCIPLRKDWLNEIIKEWEGAKKDGKLALGPWLEEGDCSIRHLNGNCVLSIDLCRNVRGIFHSPSRIAWDAYHGNNILANAKPSRLIFSDYRLGTLDNPWRGDEYLWEPKRYWSEKNPLYGQALNPAYLHGSKTNLGVQAVRKKLLHSG